MSWSIERRVELRVDVPPVSLQVLRLWVPRAITSFIKVFDIHVIIIYKNHLRESRSFESSSASRQID